MEKEECKTCDGLDRLDADMVAATCSAFERAAQICRYYLKHQNFPSRWERKSEYEKGIEIACENLAKSMLEEVGKFKVEDGDSLEDLAANWERAGFSSVASVIRGQKTAPATPTSSDSPSVVATWTNLHRIAEMIKGQPFGGEPEPTWVVRTMRNAADIIKSLSETCQHCNGERPDYLPCRHCRGSGIEQNT